MDKKDKNNGKTKLGGIVLTLIVMLATVLNDKIDGKRVNGAGIVLLFAVAAVLILILVKALRQKKKTGSGKKAAVHSHDRLHPEKAVPCATPGDHWKNQLDGFLAAGIIDRAEYRVLLRRWSNRSGD